MIRLKGLMYKSYFNYENKIAEQVAHRLELPLGIAPEDRFYSRPTFSSGVLPRDRIYKRIREDLDYPIKIDPIDALLVIENDMHEKHDVDFIVHEIHRHIESKASHSKVDYIYRFICRGEKKKLQILINYLKNIPDLLNQLINQLTPEGQTLIELACYVDQIADSRYSDDPSFESILAQAKKDILQTISPEFQQNTERMSLKS